MCVHSVSLSVNTVCNIPTKGVELGVSIASLLRLVEDVSSEMVTDAIFSRHFGKHGTQQSSEEVDDLSNSGRQGQKRFHPCQPRRESLCNRE
jgi:hypothetical protein